MVAHKVALIFSPFLAIISFLPVVCGEAFFVFVVRTYKIFPLISLTLINHLKSIILSLPLCSQRLSIVISVRLWFFGSLLRVDGWQINMGMGIVTQFGRPTDNTVLCQTLTQLLGLEKKKWKVVLLATYQSLAFALWTHLKLHLRSINCVFHRPRLLVIRETETVLRLAEIKFAWSHEKCEHVTQLLDLNFETPMIMK